ncbi:two pore domain potassium channel family protein [Pontibacter sp. JH31]|uniref:Two pore domain potassium channel family protein n=1 Tax=Pontibacter aquaedesilientis TaxID=2766980 RepID=A0ABR7XDU7_9BACT|nr:potassium channel family protein [Pontibacter aquaedesilientis]MBD1396470.1 two pore domain potassium channel family protein [Pontibacter aquaedesilientis]
MNILYGIAGVLLILVILKDLITTTLSYQGAGRITHFISEKIWHLVLKVAKNKGSSPLLDHAGYINMVTIILTWVMGMWIGAFLLLLTDPRSVLDSTTNVPATAWEKLYFSGYTLSTLGNGDFKAGSTFWDITTNLLAFSGLAFITISITYIMPVLSAVILQVKLSVFINCLGNTPQQILANGWNGQNFDRLLKNDADIADMLIEHCENHKVYPIIHYFHNSELKKSIIVSLAILDEAISMLSVAVDKSAMPDKKDIALLQKSMDFYLEVLKQDKKINTSDMPAQPDWTLLEQEGIPLSQESIEEFNTNAHLHKRRRILAHLLEEDGWNWDDVYGYP